MIRIIWLLLIIVVTLIPCCKKNSSLKQAPASQQEAVSPPASAAEKKGNNPPTITSVDVLPLNPKTGDTITVAAKASDPDNDEVKLIYQWSKNDVPLSVTSNVMPFTDDFKRGDRISLLVIPDDGTAQGNPGRMTVTIGNASPEIISSASDIKIANRIFTYQVKAVDKDDDPIRYAFKDGPAGMTIDAATGSVQWNVPPDFKGRASLIVSVSDGQGGEAVQSFAFEIGSENR